MAQNHDTTGDISVKTWLKKAMIAEIAKSPNPAAQYLAKYADEEFRWDELAAAAWLDPEYHHQRNAALHGHGLLARSRLRQYARLGSGTQPGLGEQLVHVPLELNLEKFDKMFIDLMTRPTPGARPAQETRIRMAKNVDVVGIGSCTVDYFAIVPRLRDRKKKSMQLAWKFTPGVTANNLTQVARLGAGTGWLGLIGDDENGRIIQKAFADDGMDLSGIEIVKGEMSSLTWIPVDAQANAAFTCSPTSQGKFPAFRWTPASPCTLKPRNISTLKRRSFRSFP